jgi:hypothetical protein
MGWTGIIWKCTMRISGWGDGGQNLSTGMILSNEFVSSFSSDHSLTSQRLLGLSWTYYLPRSMSPPSVLFEQPLCAEIMGAGFQKLPFSQYYELRWPRLQKIFPPDERIWTEGTPPSKHVTDE